MTQQAAVLNSAPDASRTFTSRCSVHIPASRSDLAYSSPLASWPRAPTSLVVAPKRAAARSTLDADPPGWQVYGPASLSKRSISWRGRELERPVSERSEDHTPAHNCRACFVTRREPPRATSPPRAARLRSSVACFASGRVTWRSQMAVACTATTSIKNFFPTCSASSGPFPFSSRGRLRRRPRAFLTWH